jgi:hypothetical protein
MCCPASGDMLFEVVTQNIHRRVFLQDYLRGKHTKKRVLASPSGAGAIADKESNQKPFSFVLFLSLPSFLCPLSFPFFSSMCLVSKLSKNVRSAGPATANTKLRCGIYAQPACLGHHDNASLIHPSKHTITGLITHLPSTCANHRLASQSDSFFAGNKPPQHH